MSDDPTEHRLVPTERVRGARVFASDGEKLGRIEDLAIDKRSGTVAYVILGLAGASDAEARYRSVAWGDLRFDEAQDGYVVPHTRTDLDVMGALDFGELSGWRSIKKAALI